MKKLSSTMKKFVTLLLTVVLGVSAFACKPDDNSSTDSTNGSSVVIPPAVSISLTSDKDTLKVGEEVNLTVVVSNSDNQDYDWEVSENGKDLVQIADDVLTVRDGVTVKFDTPIVVTAVAKADKNARASKTITVIAPVVEGRVGDLTSDMLVAVGNPSITVTGTLTDIYFDNYNSYLNDETVYDMIVEMQEGKWKGSWKVAGDTDYMTDSYLRGEKDGVKDYYGNIGHAMEKVYINKNNEVDKKTVKDYMSFPAIWESQHLWNHLANLNVNEFVYDSVNDYYVYQVKENDEASLYLMTYLSYSLTPLLADTLVEIALTLDENKTAITSLIGKTERLYYGLDEQSGDFDAYADTIIELTFSNVGSTTVSDPTPYSDPMHADKLIEALDEMKNATNYTFDTVDKTIYAAQGNGDDYEMGVNTGNTATGTVGTRGEVTQEKILIKETGKYSYGMDDKLYHHSYRGYVQNNDGTYDYFEDKAGVLVGKRKYTGNIMDAMPNFEFSASVFKYAGTETVEVGNNKYQTLHKFVLRENSITREVGMEVCIDGKDAAALATAKLTLWVLEVNGQCHLYKSSVPYDLVSGTYTGTYETTYGRVGTTTIDDSAFVDYVPRVIPTSWADTVTKYYQVNFAGNSYEENTSTVFEASYGDAADSIPSPVLFFEAFGDSMNGPFYDWKETSELDASGNAIKMGWVSINLTVDASWLDENDRIEDFDALVAHVDSVFAKYGFARSAGNSDITGGESGHASKYLTYINDEIMVVIENIGTRYLYIDFYKLGAWTLKK
ncbi:MAG: hypothetical protein IKT32_07595 [Clostridia bacterium]|nr:hypothetical protein [Clostridia bacterium]